MAKLFSEVERSASEEDLGSIGVDIDTIRSQKSTVIKSISGFSAGVKATLVESGENTTIEGVSGKSKA